MPLGRKLRRLAVDLVDRHSSLLTPHSVIPGRVLKAREPGIHTPGSGDCGFRVPRFAQSRNDEGSGYAVSSPQACKVVSSARPDIKLQKPAISVARNTNSKRRPSRALPMSVLRMIRNGAAAISKGTAAKAPALGPVLSIAKLGSRLVASRKAEQHSPAKQKPSASDSNICTECTGITGLERGTGPCFCKRGARAPDNP